MFCNPHPLDGYLVYEWRASLSGGYYHLLVEGFVECGKICLIVHHILSTDPCKLWIGTNMSMDWSLNLIRSMPSPNLLVGCDGCWWGYLFKFAAVWRFWEEWRWKEWGCGESVSKAWPCVAKLNRNSYNEGWFIVVSWHCLSYSISNVGSLVVFVCGLKLTCKGKTLSQGLL